MKLAAKLFLALFCLQLAVVLPRTASAKEPPAKSSKAKNDDDKKDSTKPPFNGMTKAQAIHYYGEPDSIGHREGEELWTYVLNRGESIGKSFIPFYYKNKLRYRLLTFKGDKVVKFHWDPPESD
ncbi:MAG TPA: hypothetical protein VGI60_06355 [Chthoniobacterales bacterium]|jgi:hypothetical protein